MSLRFRSIVAGNNQFVMLIDGSFGKRLIGFPDSDAVGNSTRPLKKSWANFFEQILGHVFRSWVVRHHKQSARFDHLQRGDGVLVLIADQEAMIPVFIQPAFAFGFEIGEVHDSAHGVLGFPSHEKVGDIIMPVKVLAFAAMLEQSVAGAEFDSAHNSKTHDFGFLKVFGDRKKKDTTICSWIRKNPARSEFLRIQLR